MRCELLQGCPFFNGMDSRAAQALREVYCEGNPLICARRQIAMAIGRENIPQDLTPNHDYRVLGIIEAFRSAQ